MFVFGIIFREIKFKILFRIFLLLVFLFGDSIDSKCFDFVSI